MITVLQQQVFELYNNGVHLWAAARPHCHPLFAFYLLFLTQRSPQHNTCQCCVLGEELSYRQCFFTSALNRLIGCCSTRGLLSKYSLHTSVIVFPGTSIFASSPLTTLSCFQAHANFVNITECATPHSPYTSTPSFSPLMLSNESQPSPFPASFLSLPRSPTIPAPSLTATASPPPPSALHCECLVQQPQPLLQYMQPRLCWAAWAKRSAASRLAQGRGREALQTADAARKTRQYWLPSSSTGCENLNVHWHLLICFFKAEIHLSSPVSALVCRLTHIPWFTLGKQQTC